MGKKRKTGKKEGVLLVLLVLFCTFLTGCDLLDIKDGGLGMTNPDYVGTTALNRNPHTKRSRFLGIKTGSREDKV